MPASTMYYIGSAHGVNGYKNLGAEGGTVVGEIGPGPPVPFLLRPVKFLRHHILWTPPDKVGGI